MVRGNAGAERRARHSNKHWNIEANPPGHFFSRAPGSARTTGMWLRVLLLPLLVLALACGDDSSPAVDAGPNMDGGMDAGPCEDGATETVGCGASGDGTQTRTCAGGVWGEFDACTDSSECRDGETDSRECGVDMLGLETRTCVEGGWTEYGECEETTCSSADLQQRPCGLNERGVETKTCIGGSWTDWGECDDPDVCTDEQVEERGCGVDMVGTEVRTCVDGQWAEWAECDLDYMCTPGAVQYDETCGVADDARRERTCVGGEWSEWSPCLDDDTDCTEGEVVSVPCGINGNGSATWTCAQDPHTFGWGFDLNWSREGCVDPDACTFGDDWTWMCGDGGVQDVSCPSGQPVADPCVDEDTFTELVAIDGFYDYCGLTSGGQIRCWVAAWEGSRPYDTTPFWTDALAGTYVDIFGADNTLCGVSAGGEFACNSGGLADRLNMDLSSGGWDQLETDGYLVCGRRGSALTCSSADDSFVTPSAAITDLSCSDNLCCITTTAGRLQCFGDGSVDVNDSSRTWTQVAACDWWDTACGLDDLGRIHCLNTDVPVPSPSEPTGSFDSLACNAGYVCGIESGTRDVRCNGSMYQAFPPDRGDFLDVVVQEGGSSHACALDTAGHVECWGEGYAANVCTHGWTGGANECGTCSGLPYAVGDSCACGGTMMCTPSGPLCSDGESTPEDARITADTDDWDSDWNTVQGSLSHFDIDYFTFRLDDTLFGNWSEEIEVEGDASQLMRVCMYIDFDDPDVSLRCHPGPQSYSTTIDVDGEEVQGCCSGSSYYSLWYAEPWDGDMTLYISSEPLYEPGFAINENGDGQVYLSVQRLGGEDTCEPYELRYRF